MIALLETDRALLRREVLEALIARNGHLVESAKLLGVSRNTLNSLQRTLGIRAEATLIRARARARFSLAPAVRGITPANP